MYDKRDNFNLKIVNFPFLNSNIPTRPAYGVYMSQLVRIGRICCDYSSFVKRHYIMTSKLVNQGFWYCKLCRTFKRFYKKYPLLVRKFGTSCTNHIIDGICLPATTALGRKITYIIHK